MATPLPACLRACTCMRPYVPLARLQGFIVEGALLELQRHAQEHLDVLSSSTFDLHLRASTERKAGAGACTGVLERIDKTVIIRLPDGRRAMRRVEQLSSGERRRVALALALGYAALAAQRGALSSNLVVFDEVMQHLDEDGCRAVFRCLRGLPQTSVLLCGQPHSMTARLVDHLLVVTKGPTSARLSPKAAPDPQEV